MSNAKCMFYYYYYYFTAASVMLEKALRADTTEMQWRCYGACLSSLMLVNDPLQAWLVRPNPYPQEVGMLDVTLVKIIDLIVRLLNDTYVIFYSD